MPALSWIDSYQTQLLTHTLPTLLSENQATLGPRLCDVMPVRATFMCYYLELSFKWSVIDAEEYKQGLDTEIPKGWSSWVYACYWGCGGCGC
ncbi:hypothetical protein F5Y08DRAFT_51802 [Xylaria arbuscula]|nr:hypothetical protein F5Y08DRAFT_51802 [Xylaria arbuscula]